MRYLYTVFFSLIAFSVFSQPVITSSWVPSIGQQTIIHTYNGANGLNEGSAGANQAWNLTAYDTIGSELASYVSPATAPMGSSFPSATVCAENSPFGGNNSYIYYDLNGNDYQIVGDYMPTSDYFEQYYGPPDFVHFPCTYDSAFTTLARVSGTFNNGTAGTISASVTVTKTADAYGILTTQAGTFTNVLRFNVVEDIYDTTIQASTSTYTHDHYEIFEWLSPTVNGVVLASITHSTINGTTGTDEGYYSQASTAGIQDIAATGVTGWSIMPQPSSDHATVVIQSDKAGETAEIQMHDMTGRLVYQISKTLSLGKNNTGVDVSALSDGVYTLSVNVDGKYDTQKLVVKH